MAQTADSENTSGFYQGAATSLALSKNLLRRMMTDEGAEESKGEREDEMELNLGLSLGGCHVKTEKDKAGSVNLQLDLHRKDMNCDGGVGLQRDGYGHGEFRLQKNDDGGVDFGFGLQKNDDGCADFCFGLKQEGLRQEEVPGIHDPPRPLSQQQQQEMFTSQQTQQQEMLEQQKKRELHALRRQEARKKREEKQLQKARREAARGMRSIQPNKAGKNQNGFIPLVPSYAAPFPMRGGTVFPPMTRAPNVPFEEEKRVLGAQMSSIRDKHRTAKENEPCRSNRKEKVSKISNQWDKSSNAGGDPPISNKVSVMPITYPFPVLATSPQCMPIHMAYSYPYIMPFWPAEASKSSIANPPLSPIPTRPFPPFQTAVSGALQTSWFADLQKCPGTGPPHSSHASSGRSSSAVSDNETRSCRGTCSNESSASASSAMETLQRVSSASETAASSEVSSASQIETPKFPEVVAGGGGGGENAAAQSALATSTTTTITEASHSKDEQNQSWLPTKTCKDNEAHFANMPCVSTSGDGGKTMNGFLCRYRRGEVSIVCVCHGIFLSPAEFMQHAGRTDVSHPERHILVNVQCNQ